MSTAMDQDRCEVERESQYLSETFRKLGVPYFGVFIIGILLVRVLY